MSRFRSIDELFDSPVHSGDPDVLLDDVPVDACALNVPAALLEALAPQLQALASDISRRDALQPAAPRWSLLGARLRRLH